MPILDWFNKKEALKTADNTPYKVLVGNKDLSYGDQTQGNMLIKGDNLEALKALLPYYKGRVKCIYIDPPYNTGSAFEHYDDNLEHSTWLSMMYPRLELLRELLAEDGFLCCHIDDSEGQYIKILLDEILGRDNYLVTLYVQVRYPDKTLKQDMAFHKEIEYVHVYRKSKIAIPNRPKIDSNFDKFNCYFSEGTPSKIITLGGKKVEVFEKGQWKMVQKEGSVEGRKEIWATGTILDGNSSGRFFRDYLSGRSNEDGLGILYKVYGIGDDKFDFRYFTGPQREGATKGKYFQGVPLEKLNSQLKQEEAPINNFYDFAANFGNCCTEGNVGFRGGKKPEVLIKSILEFFSNRGSIVLDSFLGSGTTAAVAHKMERKYIGIEMGEHAITHCSPRLKQVIDGTDQGGISKDINWKGGGGFTFYDLGKPIFDEEGNINHGIVFKDLAFHVWFSETKTPMQKYKYSPLLGIYKDTAYYLLYNGVLGDKRVNGGNVLTSKVLESLPPFDGPKVIYGESCRLSPERLKKENIIFKQTPYEITAR